MSMLLSLVVLVSVPSSDPHTPPSSIPTPPPNHGPGTSGGGTSTSSGETLRRGRWTLEWRNDWTEFEHVTRSEAEARAERAGEFDALRSSWVTQLALAYGLGDDLQIGLAMGFYSGRDFVDAEDADGAGGADPESATADPSGLTDAWVTAKWRVMRGANGHLALLGGVKLPTGDDGETLSNGETLEPSSQPGSGSIDYQAGLAYSRFLTARTTLDASALYTLRSEHDGFEVGDRADLGLALAHRLTEDVRANGNWSVFGELNGVWLGRDEEDGTDNENSGGKVLYLGLGLRDRLDEHLAVSLAPSLPILQDVNGAQVETDWRVGLALTLAL